MHKKAVVIVVILVLAMAIPCSAEPDRAKGLSVHFLPDRVAKISGEKGGFIATLPTSKNKGDTYPTVEELLNYFETLMPEIQENGIWIVSTNPDSYSTDEHNKLKSLISVSSKKNIPIFTCRAKDLPDGWERRGL